MISFGLPLALEFKAGRSLVDLYCIVRPKPHAIRCSTAIVMDHRDPQGGRGITLESGGGEGAGLEQA